MPELKFEEACEHFSQLVNKKKLSNVMVALVFEKWTLQLCNYKSEKYCTIFSYRKSASCVSILSSHFATNRWRYLAVPVVGDSLLLLLAAFDRANRSNCVWLKQVK